jgi:hypothetical protein
MPEFILDHGSPEASAQFRKLDAFTQAYVEALFWAECHSDNPELDDATFAELAPDTLKEIVDDCADFQACNAALLRLAYETSSYDETRAGHDFWLTRNGHGAGFWDRGLGEVGDQLSKVTEPYGSRDVYRGDDELIYLG